VSPAERAWVVEDGCIKTVRRPRIRGDLVSKQTFENFEMAFE
jgi:hypothetical protein